jgi:DNA repair protein RAD57
MTDLQHVLADFDVRPFSHVLPSLDKALVTTADLLTLDVAQVAKRAQLPTPELRKLVDALVPALHAQLGLSTDNANGNGNDNANNTLPDAWSAISTLDATLDAALGGGLPTRYLTEITGESGAGKTQFLLTLLLAVQLPTPHGLGKSAIYISTEAVLSTTRLAQLLSTHPVLATLPAADKPSLSRILSIQTPDLETQEHILRYQLPVAIEKHNVGLVILDSVAANYRAEFDAPAGNGAESMAHRSAQLVQLGAHLRALARTHNLAVVVANQVADRFTRAPAASRTASANSQASAHDRTPQPDDPPGSAGAAVLVSPDPLALDHQQRWFTGWGDEPASSSAHLKTPSLGLVWTNQLACRIALIKKPVFAVRAGDVAAMTNGSIDAKARADAESNGDREKERERDDDGGGGESYIVKWRRWAKLVFAPWAPPSEGRGVEFEIVGGGVRGVVKER